MIKKIQRLFLNNILIRCYYCLKNKPEGVKIKTIKSIISAFQFCTAIPIPVQTDAADLKAGIKYFPLTGAFIGLITGLFLHFGSQFTGGEGGAVIAVIFYLLLTKALHMDGFMDTIDGFFSGKSGADILKIMKDPNSGSFAVCGAICWFGINFVFLRQIRWEQVILIFTVSRTGIILLSLMSEYARESGTGKFFAESVKKRDLIPGLILITLISFSLGWINLVPAAAAAIYAWIISRWSGKKIGGITGDVLGFYIESSSMILMIVLSFINKSAL